MNKPKYKFINPGTLIFITGAPLSGKSTIAPLVTASIKDSSLQCMDVIRLLAQEIEEYKPLKKRNKFVYSGSCDSYELIGDGKYSKANLLKGFKAYAEAVSNPLNGVIPKLETQGAREVIFEGVQLLPSIIEPFLLGGNKLFIIASDPSKLTKNRDKLYRGDKEMIERYSLEKLMSIQEEIIKQAKTILRKDQFFLVENTSSYVYAADKIIKQLIASKVIR